MSGLNGLVEETGNEGLINNADLLNGQKGASAAKDYVSPRTVGSNGVGITNRFAVNAGNAQLLMIESIEAIIKEYALVATARAVTIGTSNVFKGIALRYTTGDSTFLLPLVIDERPVKTAKELVEAHENKQRIVFGSAIINEDPSKFIAGFKELAESATILNALVIIGETITRENVTIKVKDIFGMIEAKNFNAVSEVLSEDTSKQLVSDFTTNGNNLKITVRTNTGLQAQESIYGNGNDTAIIVDAKMDLLLGKKSIVKNGVTTQETRVRPVVFINDFGKPETIAKYNLEYGLFSIVAASLMAEKDKVLKALLPNSITKLNAGALNPIFKVFAAENGDAPVIELFDAKLNLQDILIYLQDLITDASLGINVKYKMDTTSLDEFVDMIDNNKTDAEKAKAHAKLMTAFRNITKTKENPNGLEYTGRIFEKAIEYPIGTYRDMSGIEKPLEDIDGLWLATKAATDIDQVAAYEMVTRWFLSSENPNTAQTRLKVLSEIANTTETKVTGIGYKMILHPEFVNAIVTSVGFKIISSRVLEIVDNSATSFSGVNIELTQGIKSAGTMLATGSRDMNVAW